LFTYTSNNAFLSYNDWSSMFFIWMKQRPAGLSAGLWNEIFFIFFSFNRSKILFKSHLIVLFVYLLMIIIPLHHIFVKNLFVFVNIVKVIEKLLLLLYLHEHFMIVLLYLHKLKNNVIVCMLCWDYLGLK